MLTETIKSFLLIFIAEMGDKTQMLAMAFATRYLLSEVMCGVFLGSFFNHLIAVLIGSALTRFIDFSILQLLAGLLFLYFGLESLKLEEDEDEESQTKKLSPILTVAMAFFIGELGDKTQLAAITLSASSKHPFFVLAGTVSGMCATSLVGVFVGKKLGKNVPEEIIKLCSSAVFLMFGLQKVNSNLPNAFDSRTIETMLVFAAIALFCFNSKPLRLQIQEGRISKYKKTSEELKRHYMNMKSLIEDTCLTENVCKSCSGPLCPIGYSKTAVKKLLSGSHSDQPPCPGEIIKNFDIENIKKLSMESKTSLKLSASSSEKKILSDLDQLFESIMKDSK